MRENQSNSLLNLVLFHLHFEVRRYVGFLGISALRIQHKAHGAIAALFCSSGPVSIGGNRSERVQFGGGILRGFVAVRGLAFARFRNPVRVPG